MRKGGRKTTKKGGRKGRKTVMRQRRRVNRHTNDQWASASQTIALGDDLTSQVYVLDNINLAQFDRLSLIASAYQYFRLTYIEYKLTPYFDTFKPGEVSTVPYLYWLINKGDSLNIASFNAMRDAGAKPIRFDEKTIKVAWRPSVLQENQGVLGDIGSGYKVSPWLSTVQQSAPPAPSTVQHLGIYWTVSRPGILPPGFVELTYDIQITVEFQFKKPLVKVSPENPVAVEYGEGFTATKNLGSITV